MPKARLFVELENPKDCFEILKGGEKFKESKVSLEVSGNKLIFEVSAGNAKNLMGALGSIVKQIRIIEEASAAIKK